MKPQTNPLDLSSLREAYQNEELTPRALIKELLARAEGFKDHNIWIHLASVDELEPYLARLDQSSLEDLPLFGIPFAVKDNIDVAGMPTTAACEAFRYIPEHHATLVQKMVDAGAIPLGKTNLDQFATGLVGTRSPWGECHNSFNPDYISGGSSAGSAVAVALGLVSFAFGTDTAGSGRVPASFNNLIGVKPTLGRLSVKGVVPACQTLDCVSIFARDAEQAGVLLNLCDGIDPDDPWQRSLPAGTTPIPRRFRFGVPQPEQLDFDGDDSASELFQQSINNLVRLGGVPVEIDFAPFLEAAQLLYEGPWVAERYLATSPLIEEQPNALLPVTRTIIEGGRNGAATDAFAAQYRLKTLKHRADQVLKTVDLVLTPTAPTIYTIDAVNADPIALNSKLGTYTNFMNLLDYAAVAVPAGRLENGMPWGVTLFANAFQDEELLNLAGRLHPLASETVGALADEVEEHQPTATPRTIDVLVCGAHLSGLPLNHQLTSRGATLVAETHTSDAYRMYALAGGPPFRPGLIRDTEKGTWLPVEVWRVPADQFGSFVAGIPAPLGIGQVELENGDWVCGFICEPVGLEGATDITELGGWRNYVSQRK